MKKIPKEFLEDDTGSNIFRIPSNAELEENFPVGQISTAAYARVSTQLDKQQSSYALQKEFYTDKIKHNPEWTFAGIYADEGITGTLAEKRPGFMKMIRDCRKGKINMILTKSLSRFARNTVESLQYVRELKDLGVAVVFEKEGINTLDSNSEMMIAMLSAIAQAESESISNSLKWAFRRRFAQGKPQYSFNHWVGYDRGPDGKPVINEQEAEVVRAIFRKYLAGCSFIRITDWLNEERVVRKDNVYTPWHQSVVRGILYNERYCGDALCQKTYSKDYLTHKSVSNQGELRQYYVRDCHPAIISRAEFLKVQGLLEQRKQHYTGGNQDNKFHPGAVNSQHALATLMICGVCGNSYKRTTGKRGRVWRCQSRIKYATRYCQGTPQLMEVNLHRVVMQAICGEFPELMLVPDTENPGGAIRLEGLPEFDDLLVRHMLKAIKVISPTELLFYFPFGEVTAEDVQLV